MSETIWMSDNELYLITTQIKTLVLDRRQKENVDCPDLLCCSVFISNPKKIYDLKYTLKHSIRC